MIYQAVPADELLTQGDVVDDCPIYRAVADGGVERKLFRVVILTQACDLAQTKADRVVVASVLPAESLVERGELKGQAIRDQVRRGLVYGWYFLPAADSPLSFPESIVNLRDLHTVPRGILEKLTSAGKRVCRIATPYREHMAQHFAVTYMRIALPEPYQTQP